MIIRVDTRTIKLNVPDVIEVQVLIDNINHNAPITIKLDEHWYSVAEVKQIVEVLQQAIDSYEKV